MSTILHLKVVGGENWVKFSPRSWLLPNTRESEVSEIVKDPQHKVVQLSFQTENFIRFDFPDLAGLLNWLKAFVFLYFLLQRHATMS